MSHNKATNTGPELTLRHCLWHEGFRYRVNYRRLPGSPDIVFAKYNTVIFVHGCFWHGHDHCKYYKLPKSNTEYWRAKVLRNQERDQYVWRQLEAKGWFVIIVWECQLKKNTLLETVKRIADDIRHNGELYHYIKSERKDRNNAYKAAQIIKKEKEAHLLAEYIELK